MARPKKPTYEFIPSRNEYRKRIKGPDGKYIALYAQTPDELTEKVALAQRQIEEAVYRRENPTVREYAEKWLTMQASSIRVTTLADYTSKVKIYIIEPLGDRYMQEITPDDVKMAITKAASKSASIYRSVQMLYKLIFTSAEQSKIIDESPCKNLNPKGGKAPKEKTALTTEQVQTLLDAVRGLPPYPFIMLCLYAGLREEYADSSDACCLATRDIRLARRIVRDYLFRGHGAAFTLGLWGHVCAGEERFIKPYKPRANLLLDTTHTYEVCLWRTVLDAMPADPELTPVQARQLEALRARFDAFPALGTELVPQNSLLREFIGK